jgi:hypothetical protein
VQAVCANGGFATPCNPFKEPAGVEWKPCDLFLFFSVHHVQVLRGWVCSSMEKRDNDLL